MKFVPWNYIKSWSCNGCGSCCFLYNIQITFKECLDITRNFGINFTKQNWDGFYINKYIGERCPFLYSFNGSWFCYLQKKKPLACKIWPFKVCNNPRFGNEERAKYNFNKNNYYIYVDPHCHGIIWGEPRDFFIKKVLPEFIDFYLGLRSNQAYSTRYI